MPPTADPGDRVQNACLVARRSRREFLALLPAFFEISHDRS